MAVVVLVGVGGGFLLRRGSRRRSAVLTEPERVAIPAPEAADDVESVAIIHPPATARSSH